MGIKFIYETDRDREVVEETVEKLMADQLGRDAFGKLMGP
jgi:hypothetical protein